MITHFNREDYAKNLPDAYRKDTDSNNSKILRIEKSALDALREAVSAIYDSLDLEKAAGETLDLYGEMVGQLRGKSVDSQYRMLIKTQIVRNLANGDYNGIVNLLSLIFGCSPTEIVLTELAQPCKVRLEALPFGVLNKALINVETAIEIIKEVLPAGVMLESAEFSGTFEFSGGTTLVYDEDKGFADEAQTIGGTLGYMYDAADSPALPV